MPNNFSTSPVAILFDMDECTGSWAYAGIFYTMLQYLNKENTRRAKLLFLKYFYPHCARPGLGRCFRLLQRYKNQGRVQDVVCFTHNTGVGYADFIKDCYEIASGTKGLFTKVLVSHRKGESDSSGDKCISVLAKQLNKHYKAPYTSVLCFDDRNDVWSKKSRHRVVKVPAFDGDPKIDLKPAIKEMTKFFGIRNIKQPLSRKQGDLSYLSGKPREISQSSLKSLLKSLIKDRQGNLNRKDRVIYDVFIPHIKQHVRKYGRSQNKKRNISLNLSHPRHRSSSRSLQTAPLRLTSRQSKTKKVNGKRDSKVDKKTVKNIKIIPRASPTATIMKQLRQSAGRSRSRTYNKYKQKRLTQYNFYKTNSVLTTL